jgi:arginyl-tRNA synthetase
MHIREIIKDIFIKSLKSAIAADLLEKAEYPDVKIFYPREEHFGDYTSAFAIETAKILHKSPVETGNTLKPFIEESKIIKKVNVARHGYVNIFMSDDFFLKILLEIITEYKIFENLQENKFQIIFSEIQSENSNSENHLFYMKYTCSRISSIFLEAGKRQIKYIPWDASAKFLNDPVTRSLLRILVRFPEELSYTGESNNPVRLTDYLLNLAQLFQKFHFEHDILTCEEHVTNTRLLVCEGVMTALLIGLKRTGTICPLI